MKVCWKLFESFGSTYNQMLQHMTQILIPFELNITEFKTLEALTSDTPFTTQQLAEKVQLTSGSMTYVIDKLAAKKLLIRVRCPKDKRVTYVQVTADGLSLFDAVMERYRPSSEQLFANVSPEQFKFLSETLAIINANLEQK